LPITPSGPVLDAKLTFSGPALSWLADSALKDANGNPLAAATGTSVTLSGTPASINAFLARGGLSATISADANLAVSVSYGIGSSSSATVALRAISPLVPLTNVPDLRDFLPNGYSAVFTQSGLVGGAASRNELFQLDLTNGSGGNQRGDNYTLAGSGWLRTQQAGFYYFYAVADDSVKFRVYDSADNVVAEAYDPSSSDYMGISGSTAWTGNSLLGLRRSSPVYLAANQYYRFKLDFTENSGDDLFSIGYTIAPNPTTSVWVTQVSASSENYNPWVGTGNVNEGPANAFTGEDAKYLNFDRFGNTTQGRNSGLMMALSQAVSLTSIQFKSANDGSDRDPTTYQLCGSNVPLAWGSSAWGTPVATGNTNLTTTRNALGTASAISGAPAFQYYKVVFSHDPGSRWRKLLDAGERNPASAWLWDRRGCDASALQQHAVPCYPEWPGLEHGAGLLGARDHHGNVVGRRQRSVGGCHGLRLGGCQWRFDRQRHGPRQRNHVGPIVRDPCRHQHLALHPRPRAQLPEPCRPGRFRPLVL